MLEEQSVICHIASLLSLISCLIPPTARYRDQENQVNVTRSSRFVNADWTKLVRLEPSYWNRGGMAQTVSGSLVNGGSFGSGVWK